MYATPKTTASTNFLKKIQGRFVQFIMNSGATMILSVEKRRLRLEQSDPSLKTYGFSELIRGSLLSLWLVPASSATHAD